MNKNLNFLLAFLQSIEKARDPFTLTKLNLGGGLLLISPPILSFDPATQKLSSLSNKISFLATSGDRIASGLLKTTTTLFPSDEQVLMNRSQYCTVSTNLLSDCSAETVTIYKELGPKFKE